MSIKSEFGQQLDAYFSGEMKGTDRLVFEGRVESDPMLKSEFENQKDIIESIQAHRTAELKTRLSNISVEPTLIGSLLQSSMIKPVVYAITGVAVMTGSYLFYDQEAAIDYSLNDVNGHKEYLTASSLEFNKNLELNFKYIERTRPSLEIGRVVEDRHVAVLSKAEKPSSEIAFEVPEVGVELNTDEFKAPGLALEEAKRIEEVPTMTRLDKIQINTIHSRKHGFHYKIEDNRLFLYGKFNESPYEIIELNTPTNKSLFFYYDGSFYNLNKEAKNITPLSRIEDERLTNRLDQLKSKDSQ